MRMKPRHMARCPRRDTQPITILTLRPAVLLWTLILPFIHHSATVDGRDRGEGDASLTRLIGQSQSQSVSVPSLLAVSTKTTQTHHRTLEEQAVDDVAALVYDDGNAEFLYDLSQFSLRYEKCQYVKMYDDELAAQAMAGNNNNGNENNINSPLALKHFVVFKLCPTDACGSQSCGVAVDGSSSSSSSSSVVYGKYTVPVNDYLKYVVENQRRVMENQCQLCANNNNGGGCTDDATYEACNPNEEGVDCGISCSICTELGCDIYNNLEANGLVEASNYIECQALPVVDDDGQQQQQEEEQQQQQQPLRYIGPRCNAQGHIVIGIFADDKCWEPVDDVNVETLLGMQLSYQLLNESYSDNHGCLSCMESDNNNNERDGEDADNVNEMCEKIYGAAAKCESETGLSVGFVQTNRQQGNYENQVETENLACTFINSLIWNSYTETGEINFKAPRVVIMRHVTKKQKVALSLLACSIVAIVALLLYLDRKVHQIELQMPLMSKQRQGMIV